MSGNRPGQTRRADLIGGRDDLPGSRDGVSAYDGRMRGDRVEVVVDVGTGVQTYEIAATRAGRRVEVSTGRGIVEVVEVTRGGKTVRTARFMADRVVALVEHPAEGDAMVGRPRGRRPVRGQSSLL